MNYRRRYRLAVARAAIDFFGTFALGGLFASLGWVLFVYGPRFVAVAYLFAVIFAVTAVDFGGRALIDRALRRAR